MAMRYMAGGVAPVREAAADAVIVFMRHNRKQAQRTDVYCKLMRDYAREVALAPYDLHRCLPACCAAVQYQVRLLLHQTLHGLALHAAHAEMHLPGHIALKHPTCATFSGL